MRRLAVTSIALLGLVALAPMLSACGDSDAGGSKSEGFTGWVGYTVPPTPACPGNPIEVVVTLGQWTDLTTYLAGSCAQVNTIVTGDAGDPHDFEPSPSDRAAFDEADLVVMNGADFDHWAEDALESSGATPAVVDAAEVVGVEAGGNPHLWYSPEAVGAVGAAVTAELATLVPDAGPYFADRAAEWDAALVPYTELIDRLRGVVDGAPYVATESVFDLMAQAIGLVDVTPVGYRRAAANESEPSPGDLAAFEGVLRDGSANVLIFNSQTESALTSQLRGVADGQAIPIVEVTETQPEETMFVEWQVAQLEALEIALGVHG